MNLWKRRALYFVTALLSAATVLLAAACGSDASSAVGGEVELTADDDGSQVELQRGQILVVSLESNPSTGYRWERDQADDRTLKQAGESEYQSQSTLLGAPGVETLRFEAARQGETTLTLVYHRPWEQGVKPEETFSVQVVIK